MQGSILKQWATEKTGIYWYTGNKLLTIYNISITLTISAYGMLLHAEYGVGPHSGLINL